MSKHTIVEAQECEKTKCLKEEEKFNVNLFSKTYF